MSKHSIVYSFEKKKKLGFNSFWENKFGKQPIEEPKLTKYQKKKIKEQDKRKSILETEFLTVKPQWQYLLEFNNIDKTKTYSSYQEYLNSFIWKHKKQIFFNYYQGTCSVCACKYKINELNLHHKTYKNVYRENFEDLMLVCKGCHGYIHNYNERPNIY